MDASRTSPSPDLLLSHGRFVRALARELLTDRDLAEDVEQETWLHFLRRPPQSESAARAWFRAVTARLSIESLRTRSRRRAREEHVARPEAQASIEEELAHAEVLRTVVEAVLALDEPYRSTVLLAYWRGWDARRIAQQTDTSLATVRSRLQRAHQKLRERLDRTHGRETWALALGALRGVELTGGGAALGAAAVLLASAFLYIWKSGGGAAPGPVAQGAEIASGASAGEGSDPALLQATGATATRAPLTGALPAGRLRIAGTVVDRAYPELEIPERPSADLVLHVRLGEQEYGFEAALAELDTRTDSSGRFALELDDPGKRPLFLRVTSATDDTYRPVYHSGQLAGATAELELARAAHGVLHGNVWNERAEPLANVALEIGGVAVTSAADGSFVIPNARKTRPVVVHAPGWTMLACEDAQALEEGGFKPLSVTLGPEATLRLRVIDREGEGIAGVSVSAVLPPCEQALVRGNSDQARRAKTDEHGEAELAGLWAARKLRLTLQMVNESIVSDARADDELLLRRERSAGRPIVIAAGDVLTLTARFDVERDVAGEVQLPGGKPVAEADVELVDLGRGDAWTRPILVSTKTDAAGHFAARVRTSELVGPLRVTARAPKDTGANSELAGLGYAGPRQASDLTSSSAPAAELELARDDVVGLAALTLTLEPRLAIRGLVLDRDGAPLTRLSSGMGGSRMWAAPAGTAYHGHGARAQVQKDSGRFEFPGLAPGAYDLFVSEELEGFYTYENFLHRFDGIQAGAENVELRLPERKEVHLRVRLSGATPSSTVVLHRKLFAVDGFAAPKAGPVVSVRGAQGWPEGSAFSFTGIGGREIESGATSDGYDEFEGSEHELAPLGPGWYALGVCAQGDGASFFPQCSPILWFDAGEHEIDFELLPAAILRGRVLADAAGEFLAVSLINESGAFVPLAPLDGFVHAETILDTSASGAFVLHRAPSGRFRLRAGSHVELARGEFRTELELELKPGENPPVELRP